MPLYLTRRGYTYYVRGTVSVGPASKTLYESTGLSDKDSAERYKAKLEARLIDELMYGAKHVVVLDEAIVAYLDAGGSDRFMVAIGKKLGARTLRTIGQSDLDVAARELYPTASPETRNRQFFTPFIAVWNYAVASGWAEPKKWLRPKKAKGTNVVTLKQRAGTAPTDYDRAGRFVAEMSAAPAMVMTMLFFTGMRPIEVFLLRAEQVNIAERWITLDKSKIGEGRGVPIHEFLVPLLEPLVKRGGVLFRTVKGRPYPVKEDGGGQIKTAVSGARKRLREQGTPIPGISPYTARHTVSTQLVINGVHPYIKDQILGHAVDDMSRHYTQVPQKPLIEAINSLPVPEAWKRMYWAHDPVKMQTKLLNWSKTNRRANDVQLRLLPSA